MECLYYATNYKFKVEWQTFEVVMEFPRYLHITQVDEAWLARHMPQVETPPAASQTTKSTTADS